jgi:anti-sigma factor ChrR (cupin superfamily)
MMVSGLLQRSTRMDAVTPQTADTHSHIVRPQDMDWQQTRFPGCEAKTLLFDRASGLMTALMRFAPGAVLPDHEHVNIEQTYVLEGSLVDKEGPAQGIECKAGEFIWREQGSRHVAWCPQGGLMLAIFQVPNKFFEADGRVVDAAGQDWDEAWGAYGERVISRAPDAAQRVALAERCAAEPGP